VKPEMKKLVCPQCGEKFIVEDQAVLPFCSKRCKMIDLGHWLTEKYVVEDIKPSKDKKNGVK